jgi:mRNA-degrading endonuclease RelE of RelBE toxin-antitoxin system
LYRVELLPRARKQWQDLAGYPAEAVVRCVLDQLALNPRPRDYWDCEEDQNVKFIYAGPNRDWMISYEIEDEDNVVFVHSIAPRPSRVLDPR